MPKSLFALAIALLMLLLPSPSRADDVDTAVDVVVQVGSIAGVPISQSDAPIIKTIVRCAINTELVRCARQEIIGLLPSQAQPFATCILNQTPLTNCASQQALAQLPPDVRDVVNCIAQRGDVGQCGKQLAVNAVEKQAFDVIDKLKADVRSETNNAISAASSGTIRNIMALYEGIRDDDWSKVIVAGGEEIYKAAAKIVLKIVLPEVLPASQIIDPVIDAIIQARADTVAQVVQGAKRRDAGLVAAAIAEAYLINGFLVPCSIAQIPEDIRAAVCGPVGKIIHSIADAGGTVVDFGVGLIKDALVAIGRLVGDFFDSLVSLEQTIFLGKRHDCEAPEQYYAAHYARCYQRGVRQAGAGQLKALVISLNQRCRSRYDACFTSDRFDGLCNPQQATFTSHITQLTASVSKAAAVYVRSFPQFVQDKGQQLACHPQAFKAQATPEFIERCARAVQRQVPLAGDPNADTCDGGPSGFLDPVVQRQACQKALAAADVDWTLQRVCSPPVPLRAAMNCHASGEGHCGFVDVQCDAPLPVASEIQLGGISDLHVGGGGITREIGLIRAEYTNAGGGSAKVCVRNDPHSSFLCSSNFPVNLVTAPFDNVCTHHPIAHQRCETGKKFCGTDHGTPICLEPHDPRHCEPPM